MAEKPPSNCISRRDFMMATMTAIGGFIGPTTSIPVIGYLLYPALRTENATEWIDLGPLEKYPVDASPAFIDFTVSQQNGWERTALNYGAFVVRTGEKTVQVLSNIFTYLGCRVTWHPEIEHYVSPCHNGHFGLLGFVISGPPPRPLDEFITKIENGSLFIQLPLYKRKS